MVVQPVQQEESGSIPTSSLQFRIDDREGGKNLILRYHYSGTFHPVYVLMGTAHLAGEIVAACCFRTPAARWKIPVLELARLVRKEGVAVPLTWLIGKTVKAIKQAGAYDILISYADKIHGHHGGIYQAASWNFSRCTPRQNDGLVVDGKFIAGRACNNRFGTRSATKVKLILPTSSIEPHFDEGKFLYWKALSKKAYAQARDDLGLEDDEYPKPWLAAK